MSLNNSRRPRIIQIHINAHSASIKIKQKQSKTIETTSINMTILPNRPIPGDIIHLFGYYPPNPPTTYRPRPIYKPVFTYPKPTKPTTTITSSNKFSSHPYDQPLYNHHHQQQAVVQRPTWDHESNQISSSPSFYPLVHPDEHFGGGIDEDGFGSETEAAVFSHNGYGDYSNKPTSYADDDYRPFQGIALLYLCTLMVICHIDENKYNDMRTL